MFWQIPVLCRLVTAYIAVPILLKQLVGLPSLKRRFCWQFFFCFTLSAGYSLFAGFNLSFSTLILICLGLFNSVAAYAQWRAIRISLSKTSLFTQADDLTAMLLGYFILNETKFLSPGLVAGVLFCFGAAILIILAKNSEKDNPDTKQNIVLIKWIAIYSIIWGIGIFFMRYFALENLSFPNFLFGWYGGTFLGSLIIFFCAKEEEISIQLNKKEIAGIGLLALFTWISMVLGYWVAKLAPITVFQPIYLVSEAILPTIIGLLIFKESLSLLNKEKIAYVIGIVGTIAIALSYNNFQH